jgi:hypothetical protein
MKTTDAIVEFLAPGVVILSSIGLVSFRVLQLLGFVDLAAVNALASKDVGLGVETLVGVGFLSLAYILGVLSNSLGGVLLKKRASALYLVELRRHLPLLQSLAPPALRGPFFTGWDASNVRDRAAFFRAYCRVYSPQAGAEADAHSSHVRIIRASALSLASLVVATAFVGFTALHPDVRSAVVFVALTLLVGIVLLVFLRDSYYYRLRLGLSSSIFHFLAIRIQEVTRGSGQPTLEGEGPCPTKE